MTNQYIQVFKLQIVVSSHGTDLGNNKMPSYSHVNGNVCGSYQAVTSLSEDAMIP